MTSLLPRQNISGALLSMHKHPKSLNMLHSSPKKDFDNRRRFIIHEKKNSQKRLMYLRPIIFFLLQLPFRRQQVSCSFSGCNVFFFC